MNLRAAIFLLILLFPTRAADLAALDTYCEKARKDWNVPGFSIAVVQDGKVLVARGYGVRELNKPELVTENTLFAIASNSKAFTAGAMAILVNDKKLKWDDRVQEHLPWFEVFDDPWISHEARIDDLLSHRIGFRTFSGDLIWWNTPYPAEEVVRRARYLKPQFGFRRGYGYSNIMFIAAGEVIAHVSGKAWAEFVRERILSPLQMNNTALSVAELKSRPDVATPHGAHEDGKPYPIAWQAWDSTSAAGGVISSAADLSRWLRMQLNQGEWDGKQFWTPSQTWKMWSMHNPMPFSASSVTNDPNFALNGAGLGWFLADYRGEFIVRHGGAYDGMFSHTLMAPKKKIGIVVLSNGMTGLPGSVANWALDEMLGQHEKDWSAENVKKAAEGREKKKIEKSAQSETRIKNTKPSLPLEKYAGRYGGPMYGDANVVLENGKLLLRFLPNPELTADLVHWQHDVFEVKWHKKHAWFGDGKVQFLLNQQSAVTEFKMDVPNEDFWFDELEFKKREK
ncbi:MAG TPA: serine hydrolase [Verrucomicrobiae bacterium]|nr:serine hydrolase [Verrucomicrobiae bacterium]